MIASKFGIGQQVRHSLLGFLGVVVDIDPEYSLDEPQLTSWPLTRICALPRGITL